MCDWPVGHGAADDHADHGATRANGSGDAAAGRQWHARADGHGRVAFASGDPVATSVAIGATRLVPAAAG